MKAVLRAAPLCTLILLSACGGGGGGADTATSGGSTTPVASGSEGTGTDTAAGTGTTTVVDATAADPGAGSVAGETTVTTPVDTSADTGSSDTTAGSDSTSGSPDTSADNTGGTSTGSDSADSGTTTDSTATETPAPSAGDTTATDSTAADSAATETAAAASTSPTLAQRKTAATKVASSDASCTALTPFYWEIGNAAGKQASGTGGTGTAKAPTATTVMPVASASKWVFASSVIEQQAGTLSADDVNQLSMRSGYTNFDSCSNTGTVASCLAETGRLGGTNGDHNSAHDGRFYYGGGHMQVLGNRRGLGADTNSQLASALRAQRGMAASMSYINPQLAGGLAATPTGYAQFLRQLLDGTYAKTTQKLGTQAVCTHANGSDCSGAIFSPINQSRPNGPNDISDERWHYSLGHWVEDDPTVGDGAFSSPGRFGFYPWVDKTKTWYGLLARVDAVNVNNADPKKAPYNTSIQCGRKIRAAWVKGA